MFHQAIKKNATEQRLRAFLRFKETVKWSKKNPPCLTRRVSESLETDLN
jgi:hypothetical protein